MVTFNFYFTEVEYRRDEWAIITISFFIANISEQPKSTDGIVNGDINDNGLIYVVCLVFLPVLHLVAYCMLLLSLHEAKGTDISVGIKSLVLIICLF
ncbi:hypothetical protein ACJX0J_023830, partial [Zea mays]